MKFFRHKKNIKVTLSDALFNSMNIIADLKGYNEHKLTDEQAKEILDLLKVTPEDYEQARRILEHDCLR